MNPIGGGSCVADNKSNKHDPQGPGTTAGAGAGAAAAAVLQPHPQVQRDTNPPQQGLAENVIPSGVLLFPPRGATATGIAGKKIRFHDQTSPRSEKEILRPSTSTSAHEIGTLRGRKRDPGSGGTGDVGGCGGVGVDICVSVGGAGVGAAAKARLYRGYCAQRGGDYDREYRRRGGKEMLERVALLNDTFR